MPASSGCPTPDQLRALLDGSLSDAEQTSLNQHLDACESCQRTIESLVAGKESWDGVARRLANADEPATPALADAMASAKQSADTVTSGGNAAAEADLPLNFLQPSDQPDSLGRLGPYEILQVIGRGGFGVVLKALDTSLRRIVAIKVLSPALAANASARRRFVREARAAAAVVHEHVVAIHAVADQHEPPYLVMQYIEGRTLQDRLDGSGSLAVREVLRIGMQTAAGLAAAHAQGLVHRDIKPANILLENGVERVKLTDFGLARAMDDASVTQSGVVAGTPQYMSPEQARGEAVDHRSDLFSLGSVLYAMCSGHAPFRASTTMGVLKRVCEESPRPIREVNPDVPEWLSEIIAKLLAKTPADRFQTAAEVAELLEQFLAHVQQPSVVARPSGVVAPVEKATVKSTHAASSSTERVPFLFSPMSALPVHPMFGAIFWLGLTMLVISLGLASLDQLNVFSASVAAPLSGPFMLLVGIGSVLLVLMVIVQAISKRDWRATSLGSRPILSAIALGVLIVIEMLMFAAWGGNGSAAQLRDPAMEFTRAIPTVTLLVIAAGLLLTGVVVGIRRFNRGLDTKTSGGRLWGTALTGALLAAASGGLLLVASFVSVYWLSHVEQKIATAHLTFKVAGPHVEVTLNGEKIAVPASGQVDLQLAAGEYVIATIKKGQTVVRSGEVLHGGQRKTFDEPQADAIRITGPFVMAYGPGSRPPNVADFRAIQGRWAIVSQMKNGEVVTAPQRGQWIEFDRGSMRSDPPSTPRYQAFFTESLVAIYAAENPSQIDILNVGAKGIYRLDRDTLTLAIADAGQPRPTEFVSRPGSAVTLTICRRAPTASEPTPDPLAADSSATPTNATPELDRLVELAEQELRRVQELVKTKVAPPVLADEAEEKLIDARIRRAQARQDQAEVVSELRRLVEIRESDQARMGELVKTATVPQSALVKAEKRLLDARIQLKEAETAFAMTLIPAPVIAWGPTSPNGVQLGIQIDSRRDEYHVGDVFKLRLHLRNAGQADLSTTLPRLDVLEKFDLDLLLMDDRGDKLPWVWGKAHKSRELFTVSGGIGITLRPGGTHELPPAEIVIGTGSNSPTAMAHLDVPVGQTCRLVGKLGTYGYAKGEGEPLESGQVEFRVN